MTRLRVLAAVALTLALSACGSPEPTADKGELLQEYFRSGDVEGDIIPGEGEDRIANLAANSTAEDFTATLFSAHPCDGPITVSVATTECQLPDAVSGAAHQRFALVKHDDGGLELLRLTVAGGQLYDAEGGPYAGLDDFRAKNDLLADTDQLLVSNKVTAVDGEFELVVVSGHTAQLAWVWWLAIGVVVVIVAALCLLIAVRLRRRG